MSWLCPERAVKYEREAEEPFYYLVLDVNDSFAFVEGNRQLCIEDVYPISKQFADIGIEIAYIVANNKVMLDIRKYGGSRGFLLKVSILISYLQEEKNERISRKFSRDNYSI